MSWFSRLFKKDQAEKREPDAFVRLDFTRTFPHVIWVSSVSYDREAPEGFRYKLFATRQEPEMIIDLLLLRHLEDGTKQQILHMQAPIAKFGTTDDVIRELEQSANVSFERFDLADIRNFEQFRSKAIEVGWEIGHSE